MVFTLKFNKAMDPDSASVRVLRELCGMFGVQMTLFCNVKEYIFSFEPEKAQAEIFTSLYWLKDIFF